MPRDPLDSEGPWHPSMEPYMTMAMIEVYGGSPTRQAAWLDCLDDIWELPEYDPDVPEVF